MTQSSVHRDGRAFNGRPSRCFFVLLLTSMALGALAASSVEAAPKKPPALVNTNPVSPGAATAPRVRGDADGSVTSVVGFRGLGPVARIGEGEAEATIKLYTDSKCAGPPDGTGTAKELEGAGVLVENPVAADSETTFYARRLDSEGLSGCSNGIVYQQVTTPPAPPTFNGVTPASPANENFPRISGSSALNSTVFLYADPTCSDPPVASGPAASFAGAGIEVHVADNSVTTFHAIATLGGVPSECSSSSISYQEVTPPESPPTGPVSDGPGNKPPAPTLRTLPGRIANDLTPVVTGSAPNAVAVKIFAAAGCKGTVVAQGSGSQFATGLPFQVSPNTSIDLYGRSIDPDGDESACSSTPVIYTDDSIAPRTRITAGPGAKTRLRAVVFRFADTTNGPDTSFLCKIDRHGWKACQTPLKLTRLGHRRHVLRIKAYDAAGNQEKRGVRRSFKVVRH